jgi:hypothetical protein
MKKKIKFYGFLYVDKKSGKLNFKSRDFEDRYSIYLKNAALLNLSISKCGYEFIILTNNKSYIEKKIKNEIRNSISIEEISFSTNVPRTMHFFSCHYRVDVFRYLSKLRNSISILVDLDIIIIKNLKKIKFKTFANSGIVHDISSNIFPAYGFKSVSKNLETLMGYKINCPRWYGGDFIAGSKKFFQILYTQTKKYQSRFVKLRKKLPSYTDEFFLTAAILDIKKNTSYKIIDGSKLKIWSRYWSANTKHKQMKIDYYLNFFMLHLPADKHFIANFYDNFKPVSDLKIVYFSRVSSFRYRLLNTAKKILKSIFSN